MSFNLIDLVKDQLSDQVMGQLGGILGGNSEQNTSAINGAIPGLVSGLLNSGSTSSGADTMFRAINDQDDSMLDNLGGLLGGSEQSSMIEKGSSMLGSVLGSGGLGSLVSAIAGFSGLGKGGAKSLLGLLGPVVFSVIKRKLLSNGGLSVGSLMGMLNGQKSNIASAMPSGFDQQLSASGFLNNVSSNVADVAGNVAENVSDVAGNVASSAGHAASKGGSFLGRLIPIALIIAGLVFAYNMLFKGGVDKTIDTTTTAVSEQMDIGDINIGGDLTNTLSSVTNSLGSITDAASAEAAIPQLSESTEKLSGLSSLFDKLPEAAKAPVMNMVSENLPQLHSMIDKIVAIPGVGPIIQPTINNLLQGLSKFQ